MTNITVDTEKCISCGACLSICPVELFILEDDKAKLSSDAEKCVLCMACEPGCPVGAITIIQ